MSENPDPQPTVEVVPQPAVAPDPDSGKGGAGGKDAILADLAKERDRRQALEAQLAEIAEANKTEEQKREERLTAAEKAAAESAAKALRYEAAAKAGLPLSMAGRLTGTTEEELLADAEELKGLLGEQGGARFGKSGDGGVRTPIPEQIDPNALIRAAARGN